MAVVEAILLIGFSIPLWADRVDDSRAEKDATVVRVIAQQFAWNIHYPGPDGVFGRTDVKLDRRRRATRSASTARTRRPRTTSPPSTSSTCR